MLIGDKVKVKEKFSINYRWGIHWVDSMDKTIGEKGVVLEVDRGTPLVCFENFNDSWWFTPTCLEMLDGDNNNSL